MRPDSAGCSLNTTANLPPLEVQCFPVISVTGPYGMLPCNEGEPAAAYYIQLNDAGSIQTRGVIPVMSTDPAEIQPLAERAVELAQQGTTADEIFNEISVLAMQKGIQCKPMFIVGKTHPFYSRERELTNEMPAAEPLTE